MSAGRSDERPLIGSMRPTMGLAASAKAAWAAPKLIPGTVRVAAGRRKYGMNEDEALRPPQQKLGDHPGGRGASVTLPIRHRHESPLWKGTPRRIEPPIAEHFLGRSAAAIEVRYHIKLKNTNSSQSGAPEWEVDRIYRYRKLPGGGVELFVRWEGGEEIWEPYENMAETKELDEYERSEPVRSRMLYYNQYSAEASHPNTVTLRSTFC
ncbi:hypothetical protein QBC40DRAFT_353595 [Triangularia verruculosa]|uniref:Chromo domain-containing protein n=1 Tax=Triangularia verruculosa TaxID=2587418 RepID=A0AAN6X9W0_9PEZI|nr:hypothetical protein QBC40DRAFT_353595 [Triangularia verruculosa]